MDTFIVEKGENPPSLLDSLHASLHGRTTKAKAMQDNEFKTIQRLKKSAQERCRERVIAARSVHLVGDCRKVESPAPSAGLLKRWKSNHGL